MVFLWSIPSLGAKRYGRHDRWLRYLHLSPDSGVGSIFFTFTPFSSDQYADIDI